MPINKVKKSIDDLRQELSQVPEETGSLETTLSNAKDGIDDYTPEALQDFAHAIQTEVEELEAEYPKVTELLNHIMTTLSNIGI